MMASPALKRSRSFRLSLAVACFAVSRWAWSQTAEALPPSPTRPNVLFIAVDDLKPTIGAFGDRNAVTPNLDRLAARGTVFRNAHCQQAVCAPSRASLLTGLRPDQTRVWDLKTRFRDHVPDVVTLPQLFNASGYEVVGMGKIYDARSTSDGDAMDARSWSRPYVKVSAPAEETLGYRDPKRVETVLRQLKEGRDRGLKGQELRLSVSEKPPVECADVPDDEYLDARVASAAAKLVTELAASDKPFFLAVGFAKPHLPFVAPKRYWDLYDRATLPRPATEQAPRNSPAFAFQDSWELRNQYTGVPKSGPIPAELQAEMVHGYYACVSFVDAQIGVVLDALERTGELDNTIIVLWGDHGFHLGDHGMWCKHTNYEQATRSPLIIVAPRSSVAPSVTDAPVELLDTYASLCDIAGIEKPAHVQGDSLVPAMRDPNHDIRRFAVSQYPRGSPNGPLMGYALRDRRYRFVQWRKWDKATGAGEIVAEEWYDLASDPDERVNSIADVPAETIAPFRDHAEQVTRFSRASGAR